MNENVLYNFADGVATITLNRPQVMNALDAEMIVRLREVCEQAEHDDRARVILLRGAGPAFLAGGDVAAFHANLPRLIGYQRAMELMLLSETMEADTLRSMGLVNRVVPAAELESRTRDLIACLAGGPTRAYGETKALANQAYDRSLAEQLDAEAQAFARCAATRDFAEGVTAFVEKRSPHFRGE